MRPLPAQMWSSSSRTTSGPINSHACPSPAAISRARGCSSTWRSPVIPSVVRLGSASFAANTPIPPASHSNDGARGGSAVIRDRGLEASTLATWLDAAGYRTGLAGKYFQRLRRADRLRATGPGLLARRSACLLPAAAGHPSSSSQLTRTPTIRPRNGLRLVALPRSRAPHAPSMPAPRSRDVGEDTRTPIVHSRVAAVELNYLHRREQWQTGDRDCHRVVTRMPV